MKALLWCFDVWRIFYSLLVTYKCLQCSLFDWVCTCTFLNLWFILVGDFVKISVFTYAKKHIFFEHVCVPLPKYFRLMMQHQYYNSIIMYSKCRKVKERRICVYKKPEKVEKFTEWWLSCVSFIQKTYWLGRQFFKNRKFHKFFIYLFFFFFVFWLEFYQKLLSKALIILKCISPLQSKQLIGIIFIAIMCAYYYLMCFSLRNICACISGAAFAIKSDTIYKQLTT